MPDLGYEVGIYIYFNPRHYLIEYGDDVRLMRNNTNVAQNIVSLVQWYLLKFVLFNYHCQAKP